MSIFVLLDCTGEKLGIPRKPHFARSGFSFITFIIWRIALMYIAHPELRSASLSYFPPTSVTSLKVPFLHSCVALRPAGFSQVFCVIMGLLPLIARLVHQWIHNARQLSVIAQNWPISHNSEKSLKASRATPRSTTDC